MTLFHRFSAVLGSTRGSAGGAQWRSAGFGGNFRWQCKVTFGGCARWRASGMQFKFDKPDRRGSKPVAHMNNGGINHLHNSFFRSVMTLATLSSVRGMSPRWARVLALLGLMGSVVFFLRSRDEGIRSVGRLRRYLRRRKTGAFPRDAAVRRRGKWGRPSRAHGAGTHTARHVASSPAQ